MPKKTFPAFVSPIMAESTKAPFDAPDWIFEIKLDGYRAITVFDAAGKPHLWSRNGLPLEEKFPAIAQAASKMKLRSTILDGEVVAVDENGIPRFQLLQRFQKQPTAPTLYYIFDVLSGTARTLPERGSWRAVLVCGQRPTPPSTAGLRKATRPELAEILTSRPDTSYYRAHGVAARHGLRRWPGSAAGSISMAGAGDVASNPRSAPSPLEYFDRSRRY